MAANKAIAGAVPIFFCLYSTVAGASAFQLQEQSASGIGTAFAGSAVVAEDASTVFFNPAGMAFLSPGQKHLAVGVDAISTSVKFSDGGSVAPAFQTLGNGNGGDAGGLAFVPHGYFVLPISARVSLGLGLSAPFGLKTEYDGGWAGRFQAIKSDVKTINLNPSLSFKPNDRMAFGFGINYQKLDAEFTSAVNYAGSIFQATGSLPLATAAGEGRAKLTANDYAWGYDFGAIFQVAPATRVGASYRSALKYRVTGTADFSRTGNAVVDGILSLPTSNARGGAMYSDIKLPDTLILSAQHHATDKLDLLADVSWTGWAKISMLDFKYANDSSTFSSTQENWRNTWRVAFGATYQYNEQWKTRTGIALDQSPVPDGNRTPRLPDNDRTWLSFGAQFKADKNNALDFGYSHLFVKNAPINNNAGSAAAFGLLQGNYKNRVDILGVQYSLAFQ